MPLTKIRRATHSHSALRCCVMTDVLLARYQIQEPLGKAQNRIPSLTSQLSKWFPLFSTGRGKVAQPLGSFCFGKKGTTCPLPPTVAGQLGPVTADYETPYCSKIPMPRTGGAEAHFFPSISRCLFRAAPTQQHSQAPILPMACTKDPSTRSTMTIPRGSQALEYPALRHPSLYSFLTFLCWFMFLSGTSSTQRIH